MGMGLWLMKGLEGSRIDLNFPAADLTKALVIVVCLGVMSIVWLVWWEGRTNSGG